MKGIWLDGLGSLFEDLSVSWWTYFSLVLAQIAFLLGGVYQTEVAVAYIILFAISAVSILLCGFVSQTMGSVVASVVQNLVLVAIFVIGCCIDGALAILVLGIPLGITILWEKIRQWQCCSDLFDNNLLYWSTQIFIMCIPLAAFIVGLLVLPWTSGIKIWILIAYILVTPMIATFEGAITDMGIGETMFYVYHAIAYQKRK